MLNSQKPNFIVAVIAFFIMFSCTKSSDIESKIRNTIKNCADVNCSISIPQLTNFKWDKMYVFNNPSPPDEIELAIGLPNPYYVEFARTIVFIYQNKIVHYESHHSRSEGPTDGSIIFAYPDSLKFQSYTLNQSTFKVKREGFSGGTYYVLY